MFMTEAMGCFFSRWNKKLFEHTRSVL